MAGIYKLPDYKLDDIDIFAYKGVELPNTNIKIIIQQLWADQWFYIYLPMMTGMVRYFQKVMPDICLLDNISDVKNIENFKDQMMTAVLNYKFRMYYLKMLKRLKIFKCRRKTFLSKISTDELIEIFLLLYLFNTDGLKKKLLYLIGKVFTLKNQTSETSSMSAKSMDGFHKLKIVKEITPIVKRSKI